MARVSCLYFSSLSLSLSLSHTSNSSPLCMNKLYVFMSIVHSTSTTTMKGSQWKEKQWWRRSTTAEEREEGGEGYWLDMMREDECIWQWLKVSSMRESNFSINRLKRAYSRWQRKPFTHNQSDLHMHVCCVWTSQRISRLLMKNRRKWKWKCERKEIIDLCQAVEVNKISQSPWEMMRWNRKAMSTIR